ncbi:Hypothetical protein NocV09_05400050 [Nannochloropsis oceanica]
MTTAVTTGASASSFLQPSLPPSSSFASSSSSPSSEMEWAPLVDFFTERGVTVGFISGIHRDCSSLSLADYEGRLVAAVKDLATPSPVVIALSPLMSFVAQKYLESHAAAGVVLLDPLPPSPSSPSSSSGSALQRYSRWVRTEGGEEDGEEDGDDGEFPWQAMKEAGREGGDVKLESGIMDWLVLLSGEPPSGGGREEGMDGAHPFLTREDVQALIEMHGMDGKENVKVLRERGREGGMEEGPERQAVEEMAGLVYGWYDDRF